MAAAEQVTYITREDLPYAGKGLQGRSVAAVPADLREAIVKQLSFASAQYGSCWKTPESCRLEEQFLYDEAWHARHTQSLRLYRECAGYLLAVHRCLNCRSTRPVRKEDKAPVLGVWASRPEDSWRYQECSRCGDVTVCEEHHWAPAAIFSDSHLWPTSWLCARCHDTWHAAMRNAQGFRLEGKAAVLSPGLS